MSDNSTFVMLPAIAKYSTLTHRRQTKLLIDQRSLTRSVDSETDGHGGGVVVTLH